MKSFVLLFILFQSGSTVFGETQSADEKKPNPEYVIKHAIQDLPKHFRDRGPNPEEKITMIFDFPQGTKVQINAKTKVPQGTITLDSQIYYHYPNMYREVNPESKTKELQGWLRYREQGGRTMANLDSRVSDQTLQLVREFKKASPIGEQMELLEGDQEPASKMTIQLSDALKIPKNQDVTLSLYVDVGKPNLEAVLTIILNNRKIEAVYLREGLHGNAAIKELAIELAQSVASDLAAFHDSSKNTNPVPPPVKPGPNDIPGFKPQFFEKKN